MHFDNKAIGRVIRRHRTDKGWTQEVFSGFAAIARSHLSMIETGVKQPNIETLWRIAEVLELRPSQLIAEIEEEIQSSDPS